MATKKGTSKKAKAPSVGKLTAGRRDELTLAVGRGVNDLADVRSALEEIEECGGMEDRPRARAARLLLIDAAQRIEAGLIGLKLMDGTPNTHVFESADWYRTLLGVDA